MSKQITNHLMMIRPVAFHRNEQTAVNNYYQKAEENASAEEIQQQALEQFDQFVEKLRFEGVDVTVFDDTPDPATPDSIFPNNWISFHQDGVLRLYPMYAKNRRLERREDIVAGLKAKFKVSDVVSFTNWEQKAAYLEGTGSLLLDRQNKIAYAAISDRTMPEVLEDFCDEAGFDPVTFHALQTVDGKRLPIYHTNVMMCLGEDFSVVCLDSIDDLEERENLVETLEETDKEIIEITEEQKEQFAGNMLQVLGKDDQRLVVMSSAAFHSLSDEQKAQLSKHGKLVHSDIHTIEKLGGGSARCMMAEIFNPLK
ncbi:arginine deiminase-related protein [Ekhidna sp. MALMAid0563]|uniref:citrulline utilization hydrolase CtlX n=1 Tax=Ekhidna sp. MALMAid0563 TaxID=3143937 RepID=UPI0032DF6587